VTSSPCFAGGEAVNRANLAVAGLFWGGLACAQSTISVRVCNSVRVPEKTLEQAIAEASFVLQTGGLRVAWLDCSTATMEQTLGPMDFVLGLVAFRVSGADRPGQRTMASALISNRERQSFISVYYNAIAEVAQDHSAEWQTYQILGYSIAHELGHLLLGGGHSPRGVMQAAWGSRDLVHMSRRDLKFTPQEHDRIQLALKIRIQAWSNP
jgi:hypothetical protein